MSSKTDKECQKTKKQVFLCRGTAENNAAHIEYVETLKNGGFDCKSLTVLRFEFADSENLKERLLKPDSYAGLIVTSQRAVEAVVFALREEKEGLPDSWKNLTTYCVGPATLALAESALGLRRCCGALCGNSKELASLIIEESSQNSRPFLYPCGAAARDTIESKLTNGGVKVEKTIVYETLPVESLKNEIFQILEDSDEIFVFFSPSTVEFTIEAAREEPRILQKIRAVAIGPVTAEALVSAGIQVRAVSSRPEPLALLQAILDAEL